MTDCGDDLLLRRTRPCTAQSRDLADARLWREMLLYAVATWRRQSRGRLSGADVECGNSLLMLGDHRSWTGAIAWCSGQPTDDLKWQLPLGKAQCSVACGPGMWKA